MNVLINTLWFLPAIVSGIPIIKISQTLGPYKKWYVRLFSNVVFKHIDYIICRGQMSYDYTKSYMPKNNIYNLPDAAICLQGIDDFQVSELLREWNLGPNGYIALGPSFVMRDYLKNDEYVEMIAEVIGFLHKKCALPMLLVPHSWKHSKRIGVDSVNEDYSVCCEIKEKIGDKIQCTIVDHELTAREFKSIIGNAYIAIGSRYHFLIASLSSGIPSMALGWSHKYRELFAEFGLADFVIEHHEMTSKRVIDMAEKLLEERESVYKLINDKLPDVKNRSAENAALIIRCLTEKRII